MNRGVSAAIGIICLIIAFVFFPNVMTTSEEIKTREVTEDHLVITDVAETTADIPLYNDLYDENLSYIVDLDSSDADDMPVASVYNPVSRILTVVGLIDNTTRTIRVIYKMDALEDTMGVKQFNRITPFLIMGALIATGGALIWHAYKSGRG